MSTEVATVCGAVAASELGTILMHEHVVNISPGIWRTWPELLGGQESFLSHAADVLSSLKHECGVSTIIDMSTADIGRDVGLLREVSSRSGVHIVMCTGHHRHFNLTTSRRSVAEFERWFIREIEEGVDGTPARAGVIKAASDKLGIQPQEDTVLRAAAHAHLATGAPIYLHSHAQSGVGRNQIDILEAEGVDLSRVCVGHSDDLAAYDYVVELAERGCWLGMDRYPGGPSHSVDGEVPWTDRAEVASRLIADGFADQVLLSHDHSIGLTVFAPEVVQAYFADHPDGPFFIHRSVVPWLLERGAPAEVLTAILDDNPRRFLTGI